MSLTGSGSGGSVSGNNLTVTYAITFKTNFSGSKNLYLLPIDNGGQPGSWQSKGTWTVGAAVPSGPAVSTFSPLSGAASSGTFTATFTHSGGASQHYLGYILLLPTPNVVNYTATGSCLIEYNRISNGVRLIDNAGTGWLGGQSGIPISPSAGVLQNAQCSVNVAQVVASVNRHDNDGQCSCDLQERTRRSTRNVPAIPRCKWGLDGHDAVRKLGCAGDEYPTRTYGGGAVAVERGREIGRLNRIGLTSRRRNRTTPDGSRIGQRPDCGRNALPGGVRAVGESDEPDQ